MIMNKEKERRLVLPWELEKPQAESNLSDETALIEENEEQQSEEDSFLDYSDEENSQAEIEEESEQAEQNTDIELKEQAFDVNEIKPVKLKEKRDEVVYFMSKKGKITSEGMFFTVSKKERDGSIKSWFQKVHDFTILPYSVTIALDDPIEKEKEFIKLRFMSVVGTLKEIMVPAGAVTDFKKLKEAGFVPPTPSAHSKVCQLITDVIRNGELEKKSGYTMCGWTEDLEHHIRSNDDIYVNRQVQMTSVKGEAEVQLQAYREMIDDSPLFAFSISFAASGYLRGVIKSLLTPFFNIFGDPHMGKSSILHLLAAMQGNPLKGHGNLLNSNTTITGFHNHLVLNNHGLVLIDELDSMFNQDKGKAGENILDITNGGGKGYSDQYRNYKQGAAWLAAAICSMNAPISNYSGGSNKEKALLSRMLEIDILDDELKRFSCKPVHWINTIMENYGHFYPIAIETIKNNAKKYVSFYNEFNTELEADIKMADLQEKPRLLEMLTFAMCGAQLVGDILGEEARAKCVDAVNIMLTRYKRMEDSEISLKRQEQLACYDTFKNFIANNAGRFRWEGKAYVSRTRTRDMDLAQESQAAEHTVQATRMAQGALGVVVQNSVMEHSLDFDGYVLLNSMAFEAMKRQDISKDSLIDAAKGLNVLAQQNDSGKIRNNVKVSKKFAEVVGNRGYKIWLKDLEEAPEPTLAELPKQRLSPVEEQYDDFLAGQGAESYEVEHDMPDFVNPSWEAIQDSFRKGE